MARMKAEAAFEKQRVEMQQGYWLRLGKALWILYADKSGAQRSLCAIGIDEQIAGVEAMPSWSPGSACEYSPDGGKTWHTISGEPRGIRPGDVIVNRAGNPIAYVRKGINGPWIVNVLDLAWAITFIPTSASDTLFGVCLNECDILDGPDADAVLPKIIRGEKVTVTL